MIFSAASASGSPGRVFTSKQITSKPVFLPSFGSTAETPEIDTSLERGDFKSLQFFPCAVVASDSINHLFGLLLYRGMPSGEIILEHPFSLAQEKIASAILASLAGGVNSERNIASFNFSSV